YLRFIGGTENEEGRGVAVGADGSAYLAGTTASTDFPAANALRPASGGSWDAFVVKLGPSGSVAYATHLGGSSFEEGRGVAVGAGGEAYVTGTTSSADFPVANAVRPSMGDPSSEGDAYVTKLAADGQSLVYSTYLGGDSFDQGFAVAVGPDGSAYVAGQTFSQNFPAVNFTAGGGAFGEAFVARLNPAGSALTFSAAFGGSNNEQANAVAADAKGNAYVAGTTGSTDLPVVNALRGAFGGGSSDAFVTRIGPDADLSLANADSRDPVMVGNQLTYTLTVTNDGVDDAASVSLTDTLPAGVTFVSATPSQGSCAGTSTVTCGLGALASGAGATVRIVVTPQSVGTLTNSASVTAATQDQNQSNNSAAQQTRVSAQPSIAGRVTRADGSGVGSVSLALTGSQASGATTAADGFYQFADLAAGGNYAVAPSRQGWVFHPQSRSFADVNADQTGDFTAVECVFQLTPKNRSIPAAGGAGTVTVNAPDALCPWTATSDVPWITINSGASGAGTADVSFTVAPTALPRSGTLRVGGRVFTVWQEVSPCGTATFTSAPTHAAGPTPVDLAQGDFNNDGKLDLVVLNDTHFNVSGPPKLSVLLGTGAGGFEAPRTVDVGGQLRDVAVADFNNDGKLDAAVMNGGVTVLLGDGAGNLTQSATVAVGGSSLAVADFNNDG
ncbi:MAG TPA: FG-GAP-like repeat-containing protein, partial [Pyrinomonadaceae bacterium]|nr:FG-GAP-like repeat-containing protein [Pyrinomonadaceae bacterium]